MQRNNGIIWRITLAFLVSLNLKYYLNHIHVYLKTDAAYNTNYKEKSGPADTNANNNPAKELFCPECKWHYVPQTTSQDNINFTHYNNSNAGEIKSCLDRAEFTAIEYFNGDLEKAVDEIIELYPEKCIKFNQSEKEKLSNTELWNKTMLRVDSKWKNWNSVADTSTHSSSKTTKKKVNIIEGFCPECDWGGGAGLSCKKRAQYMAKKYFKGDLEKAVNETLLSNPTKCRQATQDDVDKYMEKTNDDRAIFLISMGIDAVQSMAAERILLSIRRRGNWTGPVVLLTDASQEHYQHLTSKDSNFIVMQPRIEHYNNKTKKDMPYKRFKTYVLEYLNYDSRLDHIKLVYYLDVDILVGAPLANFFHFIETKYNILPGHGKQQQQNAIVAGGNISTIYFFEGNYWWAPVQGGQFILVRNTSQYCLERWRQLIDSNTDPKKTKDQIFLKKLFHGTKDETMGCHIELMKQKPHLTFPDEYDIMKKKFIGDVTTTYPTLLHIKNTGVAIKNIPEESKKSFIQDVLQLSNNEMSSNTALWNRLKFRPPKAAPLEGPEPSSEQINAEEPTSEPSSAI